MTMTSETAGASVGDLMHPNPIVVRADAPLSEAARLLDRHSISGLPVVDDEGYLVGVVSQTDLLRARATEHLWANWPGLAVRHLMTSPAISVRASLPTAAAARLMERERVHRLVVVREEDERIPIGVLSVSDIVHAMAGGSGNG
jgi:CBS domain-containing protein